MSFQLRRYFYSGWAFFVPYIALYLAYAWTKWPAIPGGESNLPNLLYIFWTVHCLHLLLAAWSLYTFLKENESRNLAGAIPWILLGLFIGTAGIYIEFPSDPVVHLGRILEWSHTNTVTAHSEWTKMSYFFAYSLGFTTNAILSATSLLIYYITICLLLSWQNYRLALVLGLSQPSAFLFGALQLIIAGNSTFSFHRYYGLSSTVLSQVATLALIRLALVHLQPEQKVRPRWSSAAATLSLITIVFFNHRQGLLLAAVAILALVLWRLSLRHRKTLIIAGAAGVVLSVFIALSRHPSLLHLKAQGWLNSWGGFNVFARNSAAQIRVFEILGTTGVISAALGLIMMGRRHPGGWLMTVPVLALLFPSTAAPLALYLYAHDPDALSVFSRQLFAMPLALPFAWLFSLRGEATISRGQLVSFAALAAAAVALMPAQYSYNRVWQAVARTPDDLRMTAVWEHASDIRSLANVTFGTKVVAPVGLGAVLNMADVREVPFLRRLIRMVEVPSNDAEQEQAYVSRVNGSRAILMVAPADSFVTSAASQAGQASRHWLPQEVAIGFGGTKEMTNLARALQFSEVPIGNHLTIFIDSTSLEADRKARALAPAGEVISGR